MVPCRKAPIEEGAEMRHVSLAIFLFGFWIALSGHYTPGLIALGVASATLCLAVADRIRIVDREGHPVGLLRGTPSYYPWLFKEILTSGWHVARIILHPKPPISPAKTTVHASQKTAGGLTTYANSITLTAGSVVAEVNGNEFTIFTLDGDSAVALESGDMDQRVTRFERAG
jgi:multicomponent Na+:H+ antiporter subunit E